MTPAEVRGTATFYDMLHTEPVGTYVVSVCTNIACLLGGGARAAGARRGAHSASPSAGPPPTGSFTLEEAECLADCDRAPCVQVNHRFVGAPDARGASTRCWTDLRAGRLRRTSAARRRWSRVRRTVGLRGRPERHRLRAGGRWPRPTLSGPPQPSGTAGLMAITEAPKIVTARLGFEDSPHARALPGHRRLRGAAQGADHDARGGGARGGRGQPARPGGAGFPAGRKWSMLRKNPVTYLVVNGDESEPATFKDHCSSSATRTSSSRACSSRPTRCR